MRPSVRLILLLALAAAGGCPGPAPPEPADRVVLVTIDTLRADHLPFYGYPRPTANFLAELARNGSVFEQAFAASSHTGPSHASLLTGLYPYQHRLLLNGQPLAADVPTLAESFAAAGFETAAFTSVGFLTGLARGFDTFVALRRSTASFVPGRATLDRALAWLETLPVDARFFLWIHLYDVHEWEELDRIYERDLVALRAETHLGSEDLERHLREAQGLDAGIFRRRGTSLAAAVDRYDARIRYTDGLIERLYDAIENGRFQGRTLWVVTADHGEGVGAHGYVGHGRRLYGEQLHVPLLFHYAGDGEPAAGGRRLSQLVRLVDLAPTLAELAGVALADAPEGREGRSFAALLRSPGADFPVEYSFAQRRPARGKPKWSGDLYALQSPRYKYILASEADDEFYDLTRDPLESESLTGDSASPREDLRKRLAARVEEARARMPAVVEIPEEHLEELRALGYVEDEGS